MILNLSYKLRSTCKIVIKLFTKSRKLHKMFNRNTLKRNYICIENILQIKKFSRAQQTHNFQL